MFARRPVPAVEIQRNQLVPAAMAIRVKSLGRTKFLTNTGMSQRLGPTAIATKARTTTGKRITHAIRRMIRLAAKEIKTRGRTHGVGATGLTCHLRLHHGQETETGVTEIRLKGDLAPAPLIAKAVRRSQGVANPTKGQPGKTLISQTPAFVSMRLKRPERSLTWALCALDRRFARCNSHPR